MTTPIKTMNMVRTALTEGMKTYSVYDPSGRLIEFYEAATDAADGNNCLLTTYEYDGVSSRVLKTKESIAQWDASYDI